MHNSQESSICPNCQNTLTTDDTYCAKCGQKRIHPKDYSVWHLIVESVGDFFHLDSKFFATLWPLFFRPGFLTNEYLQGKRKRYFQPFKLFLFISFLYFLTSGLMNQKTTSTSEKVTSLTNKSDTSGLKTDPGALKLSLNDAYDKIFEIPDDSLNKMVKLHGLNRFVNITFPRASWYARFMIKQVLKNRLQGSGTFNQNMQKTIPKLIFILIPFIALLLKLLYFRKKIPYFDHIIFSLHFLSFVFLLLWIKLFGSRLSDWFSLVAYFLLLVYLFYSLLRVYHQKRWKTFFKFLLLFFGSLIILGLFFIIAASISFMMI